MNIITLMQIDWTLYFLLWHHWISSEGLAKYIFAFQSSLKNTNYLYEIKHIIWWIFFFNNFKIQKRSRETLVRLKRILDSPHKPRLTGSRAKKMTLNVHIGDRRVTKKLPVNGKIKIPTTRGSCELPFPNQLPTSS